MIRSIGKCLQAGLLFTCLNLGTPSAFATPLSPSENAKQFYGWVFKHAPRGLPDTSAIKQVSPYLAPELIQLLLASEAVEIKCAKITPPDKKPPMIEGAVFIGNYEGATHLDSLDVKQNGSHAIISAHLRYVDQRFPKGHKYNTFSWVDQLKLIQQKGHWQIVDIEFKDQPSFAHMLKQFIKENQGCK